MTRLRGVALLRMLAASVISTMKVLCPRPSSSLAPTRVKMRSTTPTRAFRAGTKLPAWASSVISATWRMKQLFPLMLGPVMSQNVPCSGPRVTSLGTNVPGGRFWSSTGWRPSRTSSTGLSVSSGRPYCPAPPPQLRRARERVERRQHLRRLQQPLRLGRHPVAQGHEQLVLALVAPLFGVEHLLLVLLQLGGDVALRVLERLLARVAGRDL